VKTRTYTITNFGNTRKLPYKGVYFELPKNGSIQTEDKSLADALGEFMYVDVTVEEVERPGKRKYKKTAKKKAAARKIKAERRKPIRRIRKKKIKILKTKTKGVNK